jgi:hypothetical protein
MKYIYLPSSPSYPLSLLSPSFSILSLSPSTSESSLEGWIVKVA